jgi:hypothetical protein
MTQETQERKEERVSAAVTKDEKSALSWVALTLKEADGISGLLRRMSINEALVLHDELQARLSDHAAVAGAA